MTSRDFKITIDREDDGRWIASVPALPGVLTYGKTIEAAVAAAEALALRVVADKIEHGELEPGTAALRFSFRPVRPTKRRTRAA